MVVRPVAVAARLCLAAAALLCCCDSAGTKTTDDTASEHRNHYEYCVIGAGPAGLQLGFFLQNAQRDYVILEREASAGAFFRKYPRHRQLISINKRFTGHRLDEPRRTAEFDLRHDWNSLINDEATGGKGLLFTNYSNEYLPQADDLVRYLEDFASAYRLNIQYNSEVSGLRREGERWALSAAGRPYTCGVTVVATGISTPNVPGFTGIEHLKHYDTMSVDAEDFVGQSVLVLGNGNAAFETASNLLAGANYVHMASRSEARLTIATHYVGDVRLTANVGSVLEGYQLKSLVGFAEKNFSSLEDRILFEKDPQDGRIRIKTTSGAKKFSSEFDRNVYPLDRAYDSIFLCTGWKFDATLFASGFRPDMQWYSSQAARISKPSSDSNTTSVGAAMSSKYPQMEGSFESSHLPGLYFAGTVAHGLDWRRAAGGFIHGFRYTAQALFNVLESRMHGTPWPSKTKPFHVGSALGMARNRINEASSLYQMFGELVDVIALPTPSELLASAPQPTIRYYTAVPVGFVTELLPAGTPYMTISFEYGPKYPGDERPSSSDPGRDVFRMGRTPFAEKNQAWLGANTRNTITHSYVKISSFSYTETAQDNHHQKRTQMSMNRRSL